MAGRRVDRNAGLQRSASVKTQPREKDRSQAVMTCTVTAGFSPARAEVMLKETRPWLVGAFRTATRSPACSQERGVVLVSVSAAVIGSSHTSIPVRANTSERRPDTAQPKPSDQMVVRLTLRMQRHDRLRRRRVAARWRPVRYAAGLKAGPRAARAVVGPVNNDIAAILRRMQPRWQRYRDSLHLSVELQQELASEVVLHKAIAVALLREGHKLVSEAANLPAR